MFLLAQLPPELLLGILVLLPLGSIGYIVTLLSRRSKIVPVDVFEKKVLRQIRNGNAEFVIHAPSMNDNSRGNLAVQLLPPIIEEPMIFQLVSTVSLEITQPEPQNPPGDTIKFTITENLNVIPKRRIQWEIISIIRNTIVYKFKLDREIHNNGWKDCFSKNIDIFVVTEFEDGLYEVTDVYFLFADLFFLCIHLFIIIIDLNYRDYIELDST
jgi:hypothetical protein